MSYKIFNKKISGPFTIPAGVITTEVSTLKLIAREIPEIGILTTKSIGLKPRGGNREPIIAGLSPFSFINAVGLTNPGVEKFAENLSKIEIPRDKFLLISIFGKNEKEFRAVAKKLYSFADGFEINISCPHAKGHGQAIGQDGVMVERVSRAVSSLGKPVFAKISANLDLEETLKYAIRGGISGVTAINTIGPQPYLHDGHSILSNKLGGLSGKVVLPLGLKCIKKVREITDLPIIACGGISTAKDLKNYKKAGADFFGVGSALAGMKTEEIKEYFHRLVEDFEKGTNKAKRFLGEVNTEYRRFKVKSSQRLAQDLVLIRLNGNLEIQPGQFIFTWLPEKGEKPFSVLDDEPLTLLVQKRGYFTSQLLKLREGDTIYIRGPYGKPFYSEPVESIEIKGRVLLVGGGTGIAGLYPFSKINSQTTALLGAKDKEHLAYIQNFKASSKKLYLATENGEVGHKGLVTDLLEKVLKDIRPEYCINCGPSGMIERALSKEIKLLPPERIYSSQDFLTRCGIGLCGSCATPKGYRSCVDGPFIQNQK